jgi:tetratricopeptide (TPR) repeat protein
MSGRAWRGAALLAALTLWVSPPDGVASPPAQAGKTELRGVAGLSRVYDLILDARFDAAAAELPKACGPAPLEACDVLAATSLWWQIQLDPDSHDLDGAFSTAVDRAIEATEAWSARDPDEAEAHFYTGAAYAVRVQWRVLRSEKLAAARDGKRIKEALDRAIALDPQLDDAYFGVGMYEYYADVAPASAKVLRFLLMLPGGNRAEGLSRMERARIRGQLLQGEADYQLQIVYLWYEHRTELAVGLLKALHERYPDNPLFLAQLADVEDAYQHDLSASLATWRELLAAARGDRLGEPRLAEAEARLGVARGLDALDQTDAALIELRAVVAARPAHPAGALATAYERIGAAEDRLGHRDAAVAAYRLAIDASPGDPGEKVRDRAAQGLRHPPDPRRADAYRLSLEGLRDFERGDLEMAIAQLTQSLTLNPADPVARYRYARVLQARKNETAAIGQIEAALDNAHACPAPIAADAYLDAARLLERHGDRDRAVAYYRAAATWFGGAADTHSAALHALARLHATK